MNATPQWMSRSALAALCMVGVALAGCETLDGGKGRANDPTATRNSTSETNRPSAPDSSAPQAANPKDRAVIRVQLAYGYFQERQIATALEEVRIALRDDPSSYQGYNVLALIQMDLGDNVRAEEAFQRALRLAPNDPDVNNNYGFFLCRQNKTDVAIPYFLNALKDPLYPTPYKPYMNAGLCAQQSNDEKGAEGYFLRAFSLDPSNQTISYNLARLYLKRNDLDRATFYNTRLLDDGISAPPEALWLALNIARRKGDPGSEQSYATQLKRRFPNSAETQRLGLGQFE